MSSAVFCLLTFLASAQSVDWLAFDELQEKMRTEPRPLLIFIHTAWCKYCQMQEHLVLPDQELKTLLNDTYYCLKLDAESLEDVVFFQRTYSYETVSGYHQLAMMLGREGGELVFPTTVLMDRWQHVTERFQGLVRAKELLRACRLNEEN